MLSATVVRNLVGLLMSELEDTRSSAVGLLDFCLDHAEEQGYDAQEVVASLVEAGAIRTIVPLLASQSGPLAASAVKLLCKVSELRAGRRELLEAGAMVPVLELLMDSKATAPSHLYTHQLMRNMMAPEAGGGDPARMQTELWPSGVTAVMITLLNKILKAWDCQASSLLALDSAPEQLPSSPLHTSVVAKHELQALSLELAAWMQRWSGAWGRERPGAGAQDMVAAAAENMVAMIAALEERAMQVVIQDASSAGQLQVMRDEDPKMAVGNAIERVRAAAEQPRPPEPSGAAPPRESGDDNGDELESLIAEARRLVDAAAALAGKDRTCAANLAVAGLLFLHHLSSGLCPAKGKGTWQRATDALVPPAVVLLDSEQVTHRKIAAQVLTLAAGQSSDLATAALQRGAVEKLVVNLAASLRDPERTGYNTYASTLLSLKGQLSTLSTTNGFGRHMPETINADQCVSALVTLLRDAHPDSQHLALWALARVVSFTPTWTLQPADRMAGSSHLISQHAELYTDAQRRMQACVARSGALPAVLELLERSRRTQALDSAMPARAGAPATLYGFSQLEVVLVQVVQCFAVHQAFRPTLVGADIGGWLVEILDRETGEDGLPVQDVAAEALYWLLEDDATQLEGQQQHVLGTLKALLVAGSVAAAASIWQLCKISEAARAEALRQGTVKTLVTLLANELSDDEVEAPAALAESEATPSTMADDEWSTYLFSSYLPADPMGRGQESAAEPLPLASSPSSPKHVSSKRIMFVANAIDALATQGDARMRAELRQAGIVPLVPALMNSRDKQACVLGCRLAHALAADIGGRLALRCQSCVHDLMEILACGPDAAQQEAFRALRVLWDTEADDEHEQVSRGLPSPLPGAESTQPGWMHGAPDAAPPAPEVRPSAMRVPVDGAIDVSAVGLSSMDGIAPDAAMDSTEDEPRHRSAPLSAEGSQVFGGVDSEEVSLEEEDFILWATEAAAHADVLEARGMVEGSRRADGGNGLAGLSAYGSELRDAEAVPEGTEWSSLDLGGDMGVPSPVDTDAAAASARAADVAADLAAHLTAAMAKGPEERRIAAAGLLEHLRNGDGAARLAARQAGTLEAAVVILRTELNSGGPDENGHWEGGRCAGQAAALLWQLAYQDSETQARLRSLNIIPDLVVLLRLRGAEWIGERAEAAGVLMNLAEDAEGKQMIAQMGAIPHLVEMVSSTSEVEALMAAGCLASLAINSASNQEDILLCGGLEHIASLLTCPWPAVVECSLALLSNLAASPSNRPKMVRAGLLGTLSTLLMDAVWREVSMGATTPLEAEPLRMTGNEAGASSSDGEQGGSPAAQWLLGVASPPNLVGYIAAALHNIAFNDHAAILEIVLTGVAPSLVQILVSGQDYDRAYALALLRLLLSVPDEEVHMYLAGLGLVPALLPLMSGDAPPALAAAAQAAMCELSPSEDTNAMVAVSGHRPLLAWALAQYEAPPGWTPPPPEEEEADDGDARGGAET